jgi:epoxyqueuosine reductase QueG
MRLATPVLQKMPFHRAAPTQTLPETNQLIAVTNPYQDPQVTAAILKDSDSKATRFVMLARGDGAK